MSRRTAGHCIRISLTIGLLLSPAQAQSAATLAHYDPEGDPAWRIQLPPALAEISGIAFTSDGRLLAHGDEQATVYHIDLEARAVRERLAFGSGFLPGDFEDIEVVGDHVFLVSSRGELLRGRLAEGSITEVARVSRGLGGGCEVEGMTFDQPSGALLLLCKRVQSKRWKDQVVVLAISPETGQFEARPRILVPESELKRVTGSKRFGGSAIARHPRSGTYLLVAGPERAVVEIDAQGRVLGGGRLKKGHHRQPEGIAIAPDLTLLISDEAAGKAATITAYEYRE